MRFAVPSSTVSFPALVFALAAVLVPAAPRPATAADSLLEALLAKSRAASGAPYRYHVISKSREDEDGHTYEVTTETEGLKYLARKCVRNLCTSGFYFDGERSFNTNFNDTALPLSARVDGLQLTLRAIASYAFTAPDFRAKGGTVEARDSILRDGKQFGRIAVAPRLGALLEAVIDPDTGLVVGVISDERRLAFEFRDQRKVGDRITLPYAVYLNGAPIEKFDDRSIDPAPLAAPAGIVPQIAGGAAAIAMTRGDAPIVPCSIGGRSATCLFDTGNSGLAIGSELAGKLGLVPQTGGVIGAAGSAIAGVAKAPALSVGGATFPPAQYVVIAGLRTAGYDIVLGADAFANARISLDFERKVVTVAGAGGPVAGGSTLSFENFVPTLAVALGGVPADLSLDTGDASAVELAADWAAAHPNAAGDSVTVRLGADDVSHVHVVATKRLGAPDRGVIGSGLLQHFVTTFDYAHARIGLVPQPRDADVKASP
jgi:hypothetical protein